MAASAAKARLRGQDLPKKHATGYSKKMEGAASSQFIRAFFAGHLLLHAFLGARRAANILFS